MVRYRKPVELSENIIDRRSDIRSREQIIFEMKQRMADEAMKQALRLRRYRRKKI